MKCFKHQESDASAVCIRCGKGVCITCVKQTATNRVVCSAICEAGLAESEQVMQLIKSKTISQNKVSAMIYFLIGSIAVIFAVLAALIGEWALALWCAPFGIAMIVGGIWSRRVANESR